MHGAMSMSAEHHGVETLYATGSWLLSRERIEDAAKVFRALTLVAPSEDRSWLSLGLCHERLGQPVVALELYGLGTVAAAPAPRCWIAKSRILRALDRAEEADFALSQAADAVALSDDDEALEILKGEVTHAFR